ncbi:Heat shock 70 kDa protein 12A [Mactra antiquata]
MALSKGQVDRAALSKKKPVKVSEKKTSTKLVAAAIDFGTAFSGWAYSMHNDKNAIICKHWNSGTHISLKAPTTVLIQPDGKTFDAFGYDAENRYANLFYNKEHAPYYYFQQFKMLLYNNKTLTRKARLEDAHGKRLLAKTVFSLAIKYLKDDLLSAINISLTSPMSESDIQWVLTVPAIWNFRAKQFMRECAVKAGIKSKDLRIALEPEAASLYCKQLEINKKQQESSTSQCLSTFEPGSQYVIVDAGGGTVDIIVHRVNEDGTLTEISAANGGDWGGTCVDRAFMSLVSEVYNKEVVKILKDEHIGDYIDLLRELEIKKRTISSVADKSKLRLKVPVKLNAIYESKYTNKVTDNISQNRKLNGRVTFETDKIFFDQKLMEGIFEPTTRKIVGHLKQVVSKGTDTIIMVGGFSESPMLLNAIQDAFKDYKVILPAEAGLSVLKGAVLYGHERYDISIRVSPYTYGFKIRETFDPAIHDKGRMYVGHDGTPMVRGVFAKLIQKNQNIPVDSNTEGYSAGCLAGETSFDLKLFASTDPDPMYVDDSSCFEVGRVIVDCKDNDGKVGSANISLKFGGTEVEARAVLKSNGKLTKTTFNFLD